MTEQVELIGEDRPTALPFIRGQHLKIQAFKDNAPIELMLKGASLGVIDETLQHVSLELTCFTQTIDDGFDRVAALIGATVIISMNVLDGTRRKWTLRVGRSATSLRAASRHDPLLFVHELDCSVVKREKL